MSLPEVKYIYFHSFVNIIVNNCKKTANFTVLSYNSPLNAVFKPIFSILQYWPVFIYKLLRAWRRWRVIRREIDSEKTPIVRKAFELYATGEYTLKAVAKILEQAGLRSYKGNILNSKRFAFLAKNGWRALASGGGGACPPKL